jgi:hypothetical protein
MATIRSETRNQLGEIVQVLAAKLVVPRRHSLITPSALHA